MYYQLATIYTCIFPFRMMIYYNFNILCLCIGSKHFCNILMYVVFVIYLPEDGHLSG